ncbi:hypothetical protein [Deinococcus yunweiensis]|uniref:hypothetical protein n=1 Tax=Deinococcus yunweiensis TaxID=367282 RepID=UPI00398E70D5
MNATQMRRNLRWGRYVVWSVFGLLLVVALLVIGRVGQVVIRPPPLRFTQEVYAAVHPRVCPGDVVEFRSTLIVTRVPAVVVVARTLWDVQRAATVQPDTVPKLFVWTVAERGRATARDVSYPVPLTLPPGRYEVRGGATAFNSDAATYRVPFEVRGDCTQGAQ